MNNVQNSAQKVDSTKNEHVSEILINDKRSKNHATTNLNDY